MYVTLFSTKSVFLFDIFQFLDTNVPLVTALFIEKLIARGWISWTVCKTMHICNLISVLLVPVYVINFKYEYVGPGKIQNLIYNISAIIVPQRSLSRKDHCPSPENRLPPDQLN
jgi:hypothetical protein